MLVITGRKINGLVLLGTFTGNHGFYHEFKGFSEVKFPLNPLKNGGFYRW